MSVFYAKKNQIKDRAFVFLITLKIKYKKRFPAFSILFWIRWRLTDHQFFWPNFSTPTYNTHTSTPIHLTVESKLSHQQSFLQCCKMVSTSKFQPAIGVLIVASIFESLLSSFHHKSCYELTSSIHEFIGKAQSSSILIYKSKG